VVHDAVETLNGPRHRTVPLSAALLAACVALLAGCGGASHSGTSAAGSAGTGVGESLRLDNCTDWNHATVAERHTTVAQLRRFAGGPVGSSAGIQNGPVLSDERAYNLLEAYCSHFFARGFKLYKLYTHAAGIVGQPAQ
jgi:hypothetical protein